jgi:Zn-finger nucleic acid-binding protein/ribosomal protein L40E
MSCQLVSVVQQAHRGGSVRLVACPNCHAQFDVTQVTEAELTCHCGTTVPNVVHAAVDAQVHRCGSCGASVSPQAESCDYCSSAIVRDEKRLSLICPECYARSAEESSFCTGCGVEFRPQAVIAENEAAITCPSCDSLTRVRGVGGMAVYECKECLGLWVPGDQFDALIHRAAEAQRARPERGLSTAGKRAINASFSGKVVYRRCPVCSGTMQRKNYGRSGVIIDWCGEDGTWLDADELEAIASFVTGGGLQKAVSAPLDPNVEQALFRSAKLKQIEAVMGSERTTTGDRAVRGGLDWLRRRSEGSGSGILGSIADLLEEVLGL